MNRTTKSFLIAFIVVLAAIGAVVGLYQRHLRFLMTDFSGAKPPAMQFTLTMPCLRKLENLLIVDGMQMPFAESDIMELKPRYSASGNARAVGIRLTSGVNVFLQPRKGGSTFNVDKLRIKLDWDLASREDFHWGMNSEEVSALENHILDRGSQLEVVRCGFRDERDWCALIRVYSTQYALHEVEWVTKDERWGGVMQIWFSKSHLNGDVVRQREFLSHFEIVSPPQGRYEEELKQLIERVRAKDPTAVKESPTAK